MSEDNTVKIADVGLAKAETDITGTFKGTPVYMAPEVFHSQVYDSKADIYSLALLSAPQGTPLQSKMVYKRVMG